MPFIKSKRIVLFVNDRLSGEIAAGHNKGNLFFRQKGIQSERRQQYAKTFCKLCHRAADERHTFLSSSQKNNRLLRRFKEFLFFPAYMAEFFRLSHGCNKKRKRLVPSLFQYSQTLNGIISVSAADQIISADRFHHDNFLMKE